MAATSGLSWATARADAITIRSGMKTWSSTRSCTIRREIIEGGEFIELYNRGDSEIDLTGWRFTEGVNFAFPTGTTIKARGYLVVAADIKYIKRVYQSANVVGNYRGELSNPGEMLRLEDAYGNLADEVDYSNHGDWPDWTKGAGTSMELINPWVDNNRPSAWRDSDERGKSTFREYGYWSLSTVANRGRRH